MNDDLLTDDRKRYGSAKMPLWALYFRKAQYGFFISKRLFKIFKGLYHIELSASTKIGCGFCAFHPYGITINPNTIIGSNVNIFKGVTIGQTNRGAKGVPIIGNFVFIGLNSTVVDKITIGDDVLIAPNSFVNRDVPSHSIVIGNPCVIKHKDNATEGYLENTIDL